MKQQRTDKIHSFENWRIKNKGSYGSFIWPQLNYNFSDASIISIIFEQKPDINITRHRELINIIEKSNLPYFIINFLDEKSKYFISPQNLDKKIGLTLTYSNIDFTNIRSYWDFRLATIPKNCLSADIDSLEISDNFKLIAIEAAQLFDTSSKQEAIKHIFRTFKRRHHEVNPKQYLAQYKFSLLTSGEAYILFHKINDKNELDDKSECLLLRNNKEFYEMLCFIKDECSKNDEKRFIQEYGDFLTSNLVPKKNIHESYEFIKSI